MKIFKIVFTAACFCALVFAAGDALAKNDKGRGKPHKKDDVIIWNDKSGARSGGVSGKDVDILRGYVIGHYKRNCPPGLAKKNPPCVPPGQARKYRVGSILPDGIFSPIPRDILSQLTPPPHYARYVRVDRDVYLITEGTRKVLEAIELFSAVN